MATLVYRNINDAFIGLVEAFQAGQSALEFKEEGETYDGYPSYIPMTKMNSRNGPVITFQRPVTVVYERPKERVLFNGARDCNPFFHLYEALWMLAGRNDVLPLKYYNSQIAQYSDDGVIFHGAYGYRWRKYFGYDQIQWIIDTLRDDPESRRNVLQMWDGGRTGDLYVATHGGKDVPCNLCITFGISRKEGKTYLNFNVVNRSNDLIWGMLGANLVHMSMLHEYIASEVGMEVGHYAQISTNLHLYLNKFNLAEYLDDDCQNLYESSEIRTIPLMLPEERGIFLGHVEDFVEANKDGTEVNGKTSWDSYFLNSVAQPMCHAFHMYKEKDFNAALHWCHKIYDDAWKQESVRWITKRKLDYERKPKSNPS